MIILVIHNHYTDKSRSIRIPDLNALDDFAENMGINLREYATPTRDLTEEANLVAQYLSNHHLDVEVVNEDEMQAAHNALKKLEATLVNLPEMMHKSDAVDMYNQYQPQLEAIAKLESAGHTQRDHPLVMKGVHKGTKSTSSYGLMPLSLHMVAKKDSAFANTATGKLVNHAGGQNANQNWQAIAKITANQTHDNEAAAHMWNYEKQRVAKFASPEHDLDALTAYAHRNGIQATRDALSVTNGYQNILNHPYVKKFLEYFKSPKK